jgi:MFS transporter, SHS family, lactate transporter
VLSLVVLPLWAFAASAVWLAIGAFLMQVMVQGAWGVIPVDLNELSPDDSRGTFPGFVYQLITAAIMPWHSRSWRVRLRSRL